MLTIENSVEGLLVFALNVNFTRDVDRLVLDVAQLLVELKLASHGHEESERV